MKSDIIISLHKNFEEYANQIEGEEFWFARDLQTLLGYSKWENFLNVIDKAKTACANAGHAVEDHFPDVRKMIQLGKGAEREAEDIVKNNQDVRKVLTDRGIRPEELPAAEDINKLERRVKSEEKKLPKQPVGSAPRGRKGNKMAMVAWTEIILGSKLLPNCFTSRDAKPFSGIYG